MKKIVKATLLALSVIAVMAAFTACKFNTWSTITYDVETGDKISLKLTTTSGYSQDAKNPFTIKKGETEVMQGTFVTMKTYGAYEDALKNGDPSNILDRGTKDGNDYIFYTVVSDSQTEYDYLVKIANSKTGVLLGSISTEEEAKSCFEAICFGVAQ